MGTIGEQVLARITDIEAQLQILQGQSADTVRNELNQQMNQLRSDITKITTSVPVGAVGRDNKRTLYNSKEFIPEKLGSGYKDA